MLRSTLPASASNDAHHCYLELHLTPERSSRKLLGAFYVWAWIFLPRRATFGESSASMAVTGRWVRGET